MVYQNSKELGKKVHGETVKGNNNNSREVTLFTYLFFHIADTLK